MIGEGFLLSAFPTARQALGRPILFATHLYERTCPLGMVFAAAYTLFSKAEIFLFIS
jgi:hypothetical protein